MLHLVTAADGAAEHYGFENEARYETVDEAIHRDKCLREAYIGHNKVFMIGNGHSDGFRGKMNETIASVKSVLGLPNNKLRYKKFLLDQLDNNSKSRIDRTFEATSVHESLFQNSGIKPYNSEQEENQKFFSDSLYIRHTYLNASENSLIFIRQKSGSRINSFDYEQRFEQDNERIQKKRIIQGREYEELI